MEECEMGRKIENLPAYKKGYKDGFNSALGLAKTRPAQFHKLLHEYESQNDKFETKNP